MKIQVCSSLTLLYEYYALSLYSFVASDSCFCLPALSAREKRSSKMSIFCEGIGVEGNKMYKEGKALLLIYLVIK